jgi:hypothetical protein
MSCAGYKGTYATVGTVSAPALLRGLVDLDVLDDQVAGVETLGVGVGLCVLEESEEDLGGLYGPASPGDTESLAWEMSACSGDSYTSDAFQYPNCTLLLPCILCIANMGNSPWAVRPVPPAYRLMGIASLCSKTLPR